VQRSGIAEQEVRAIMAEQLPRADRLAHASDVLENIGSVANLRRQVARLHAQYLELAARRA
jgi:dephospho-CoA kinase